MPNYLAHCWDSENSFKTGRCHDQCARQVLSFDCLPENNRATRTVRFLSDFFPLGNATTSGGRSGVSKCKCMKYIKSQSVWMLKLWCLAGASEALGLCGCCAALSFIIYWIIFGPDAACLLPPSQSLQHVICIEWMTWIIDMLLTCNCQWINGIDMVFCRSVRCCSACIGSLKIKTACKNSL